MSNKPRVTHFTKFWLPVYLYAGLIFFYSSLTRPPLVPTILHGDKLLHLVEYAILGYLIARAASNSPSGKLRMNFRILAVICAGVYGISDELHQHFVPGRQTEILDLLADTLGAAFGQAFYRG